MSNDITAPKRAEEQRILLGNELSHRVKNMLATLQAIVRQTIRNASSLDEAATVLAARIQSMDAANDLLVNGGWEDASIHDLIDRALAPFRLENGDQFRIEGPAASIPQGIAIGFALALHELATNAAKYGALSVSEGRIDVSWSIERGPSGTQLRFRWHESDGPPVTPPTRVGFGSKLINRVLASEIDGAVNLAYDPEGVVFEAITTIPDEDLQPQGR